MTLIRNPFPCVLLGLFATILSLCTAAARDRTPAANRIAVIPQPVDVKPGPGAFTVTPKTEIVALGEAIPKARQLVHFLEPAMGFRLNLVETESPSSSSIVLAVDPALLKNLGAEGYTMNVATNRVDFRAAAPAGLFHGMQTLRQLLPPPVYSLERVENVDWSLPCVVITDYPRFQWRGLLIDPARHFIPVQDVKAFLDTMALHKFNRLQMHLTDNEGWRIEIKRYPDLTGLASQMDWNLRHRSGKGPHGIGFYTQEEIRELVRYAAERHITIIPEIEMPYHAGAAIVAYPQHGVNTRHLAEMPLEKRWASSKGLLGPRPETVTFMQHVLAEVMDLFPGQFIHIGGDEANLDWWAGDPEMQALMRELECEDAHKLHSWFLRQMDAYLTRNGRRMIGWDEILQGGLAPGATVMSWRGVSGGISAARAGHDVIMAPTSHTYFDYYQGQRDQEPEAIGGFIPVEKVYDFEPVPGELTQEQAGRVLGGQGQLWGEFIATPQHRDYMAWPRACALSESLWSPKSSRHLDLFLLRLDCHLDRLKSAGINYRPPRQRAAIWPGKTDENAPQAARALLKRLLPDHVELFSFDVIPPVDGRDVFEIEAQNGEVAIRGNTAVSMAMGLNWYLKYYCRCHVSWFGNQLELPDPLPGVQPKLRIVSWARYRYFLNYCCFGYSLPWWDWAQWESLIDWMALNGVNMPLAVTGQEAVWQAVCRQLGLTEEQIAAFIAGPPYLPFGWMGCLDGWGGPLPQSWIDRHEQLQQRILARQRALGMTPVLQGFTGHVPAAVAEIYPEAKLHQIRWIEWRTHLLDPLDPLFSRWSDLFLREQSGRFGTDHLYAADTFIEMTPPSGELDYLKSLGQAIYDGMVRTDPEAVWILQGWSFMNQGRFWTQPRFQAFLDAVPDECMVVLDLFCESTPMWSRTDAFCGKPWLWCNVQNFGHSIHLGGALDRNNSGLMAARRDARRGELQGLGIVNEGLGYNPVAYDLMFEMAWRNNTVDLDQWIREYPAYRYGKVNRHAQMAWQMLKETVYAAPNRTRSAIDHPPSLQPFPGPPYGNAQLAQAWNHLLQAAEELGEADTYRFDLVNVARQVLSNHAAALHREMAEAFEFGDAKSFRLAADAFLKLIGELDALLATRPEFLLGRWLEDARRWGENEEERARFEWNARRVLTLWGEGTAIDDYARKEWAGMMNGYYSKRWEWYLDEVGRALEHKQPFDNERFQKELRQWMVEWSDRRETYPVDPQGDSIAEVGRLWAKYGDAFKPDALSLTTGKPVTCSAAMPQHPAHFANDGLADNTDRYWAVDVADGGPAWWQVDLGESLTVGRVVVVGFYGDRRHYGFTVETSLNNRQWELVADWRDNKVLSSRKGYHCTFEPRHTRYIRVMQTHNSANTGRHLVEVMAFEQ